jgi:DNA polymerase-3 subunit gamma/tau
MIGQEHITRTLRNSLKTGRIRHAYLFSGPRGTGKTTTARLLAKAVNCRDENPDNRPCNVCPACIAVNEGRYLDLIEIDAATHTGVDDVRDLRDKIAFAPGEGQYKVYIIDEVHRFTGNAFDALLKTLEEPPSHAIFVLATTEIDKVPPTIKSRCLPFEFRRVPLTQVADRLQLIAEEEGLQVERAALEVIARHGTGSVRDSISLLDQIVSDPNEVITLELTQRVLGTANTAAVKDLIEALVNGETSEGLHIINEAVDAGSDPRQFGQQVIDQLRAVLLAQAASADLVEASQEDRDTYTTQAQIIPKTVLLKAIRAFNEAVNNYRGGWQPQLALELALVESLTQDEPVVIYQQGAATAQQAAQQIASQPQAEATPGIPAVVPTMMVREKWRYTLRTLYNHNQSAPAIVEHFQVLRVEGNVVVLGTDNDLYLERLQHPEKLRILEWVLSNIHKVPLRVRLMKTDGSEPTDGDPAPTHTVDMNDPLVSLGLELGAEIKPATDDEH